MAHAAAVAGLLLGLASPALANRDRHAGYYYPPVDSREVYTARAITLADANRDVRLGFIVGVTKKMLERSYPPRFVIFAKGDEAEKMIIIGLGDGYLDTIYRARAVLAMLTSVVRTTRYLNELGVADFFTFFDLAKLLGFKQITISDGDHFSHQIIIE